MRTRVDPNNRLSLYRTAVSQGIFLVQPDSISSFKVVVKDSYENESILRFTIKGLHPAAEATTPPATPLSFSYMKLNTFEEDEIRIKVPGSSLYNDFEFSFSSSEKISTTLSPVYSVHNPLTPLHDYIEIEITIDPDCGIPVEKLLLAHLQKGRRPVSAGGKYANGRLKASVREFGDYALMADTTAPEIKPETPGTSIRVSNCNRMKFTIQDDLSGIGSYVAVLNNQWIVLEYDAKNNLLTCFFDNMLTNGEDRKSVV